MDMDQVWDYGVLDVHLSAVLDQYDSLKTQQLKRFQQDVDLAKQSRTRQELDSEKNDVEVLMKKLRARFPNRTPTPFAFAMPQKVEKDQIPSESPIPQLADNIAADLFVEPDNVDTTVDAQDNATTTSATLTHDDGNQMDISYLPGSAVDITILGAEPATPFTTGADATFGTDTPADQRSPTPPHLNNPLGNKRKAPLKIFGQLPSIKKTKTKSVPTLPPGPPLTDRTISFDEVYQDGNAQYKHMIVHYGGHNYILKCEEHGVHFKPKAITAAAKHLDSDAHGNQERKHSNAVAQLGYLVTDCTPEQIQQHNNLVLNAYALGYRPLRPKIQYPKPAITETRNNLHHNTVTSDRPSSIPSAPSAPSASTGTIIDPVAGELYYGRAKPMNPGAKPKSYIVMVLPWKQLPPLGGGIMAETLGHSPLLREAQRKTCYIYDQDGIAGWMPGYEDGGQHVKKRWFPVLWFEKTLPDSYGWLRAGDLTPFDQGVKVPAASQARALHSRAVAREFFGTTNLETSFGGPGSVLDGPGDALGDLSNGLDVPELAIDSPQLAPDSPNPEIREARETSPLGSEGMDLDSSSEDEGPLMETRRQKLPTATAPEEVRPASPAPAPVQPGTPHVQLGSPIKSDTAVTMPSGHGDNKSKGANLVITTDCATGMAAAALLARQAIEGSAATRASLEEPGSAVDGRARSTASPGTSRADSVDRSASEARSARVTPASSVDRFPLPNASATTSTKPIKQVKGGPASARNAWQVAAYANGTEPMHHYQHAVRLVGSKDGIARTYGAEGPTIVIYAKEVRKITLDESQAPEGRCGVTIECGNTTKRLVLSSNNGRSHYMAVMFKRWFGKFLDQEDKHDNSRPSSSGLTGQREGAPPPQNLGEA
ncbi:hypothetical protein F5X68DRAFT_250470 [Plectosphaerella plurivora]|uniref:Uncharacterized protein n=1 Tax=Plectosphaerella plurivora TaxID=936078 RepID=A0A9P8VHI9_9PEZI|nr:hypothetical protein F5X68DRAFT_250470 [Plectosphaerella plurivora]